MTEPSCLVILPSRNEEATIGRIAEIADLAVSHALASMVHCDASSNNNTVEAFNSAQTLASKKSLRSEQPGKGRQIIHALRSMRNLSDVILILDTDNQAPSESIYRELYSRIKDGADFSIVNYRRHWFEGNLTNHVARPIVFANVGIDVAQPISGELAISRRHAENVLRVYDDLSEEMVSAVNGYGIDPFLLLTCTVSGGRVFQISTTSAKLHAPSFPHLPRVYSESVPVLFSPRFRKPGSSSKEWNGRFELHNPPHAPDIAKMISELELLGACDIGESLPEKMAQIWYNCQSDQGAVEAAEALWIEYLSWVRRYLRAGLEGGVVSAELLIERGYLSFFRKLASLQDA